MEMQVHYENWELKDDAEKLNASRESRLKAYSDRLSRQGRMETYNNALSNRMEERK